MIPKLRLDALTDGVFAVAMTLLVIDLRLPENFHPADSIGSMFVSNAKSFLTTAKQLMRRIRDKTPYISGDRMMLNSGSGGWMVEGSLPRLLRDYNQLIEAYNRWVNI